MKKIERARQITEQYERATATQLSDVYRSYSGAKDRAFKDCERLMEEYYGFDLKILSYNTFVFTAAFLFFDRDTDVLNVMFITPSRHEAVEWAM